MTSAPELDTSPDAPAPSRPRRSYKVAGPQAWAEIQALYLVGVPAPELALRFDVTEHNIRKRATRDKWTRRAHAEAVLDLELPKVGGDRRPPEVVAAMAEAAAAHASAEAAAELAGGEAEPVEAARLLLRRAAGAAQAGRLAAASERVKLAEALARAAGTLGLAAVEAEDGWAEDGPEPATTPEELEALRDEVERRYARFDCASAEAVRDAATGHWREPDGRIVLTPPRVDGGGEAA